MDLLNKTFSESDSETGSSFSAFSGIDPLELSDVDLENISLNNDISFKDLGDDSGSNIEFADLDEIIVGNNNAVDYNVPSPEEVSAPRGEKRKHSDDPDNSSQSPSNGFVFSTPARKRVKPLEEVNVENSPAGTPKGTRKSYSSCSCILTPADFI